MLQISQCLWSRADDGVMPQTEEAISHARAADVPIIIALNKIDLPGVDENRVMQGLAANDSVAQRLGRGGGTYSNECHQRYGYR